MLLNTQIIFECFVLDYISSIGSAMSALTKLGLLSWAFLCDMFKHFFDLDYLFPEVFPCSCYTVYDGLWFLHRDNRDLKAHLGLEAHQDNWCVISRLCFFCVYRVSLLIQLFQSTAITSVPDLHLHITKTEGSCTLYWVNLSYVCAY